MNPRLDLFTHPEAAKAMQHLIAASRTLHNTDLPESVLELVRIRASQINGCAACLDRHTKDAAHAGEPALRINLVATWREATVFTDAERAALELAEAATRVADIGHVAQAVWMKAAAHFNKDQLATLVCAIGVINAFNRVYVMLQQPAGNYTPGQAR